MSSLERFFKKYRGKELCNVFQNELEIYLNIDWSLLLDIINEYKCIIDWKNPKNNEFIIEVLKLLSVHRCGDIGVISEILFLFVIDLFDYEEYRSKRFLYHPFEWETYVDETLAPRITDFYENWHDKFNLILTLPYEFANQAVYYYEDAVRISAVSGSVGHLYILMLFGAILIRPIDNIHEWRNTKTVLHVLFKESSDLRRPTNYYFKNPRLEFSKASRERIFLIMRGLEIFVKSQRQPKHSKAFKMCFDMLFSCIPDPLMTTTEVFNFCKKMLPDTVPTEILLEVVSDFGKFAPECRNPLTPNSLMHLCRFRIRECLRTSKNFPHGLQSLPLPTFVKDYIQLKIKNYTWKDMPIMCLPKPLYCKYSYDAHETFRLKSHLMMYLEDL